MMIITIIIVCIIFFLFTKMIRKQPDKLCFRVTFYGTLLEPFKPQSHRGKGRSATSHNKEKAAISDNHWRPKPPNSQLILNRH